MIFQIWQFDWKYLIVTEVLAIVDSTWRRGFSIIDFFKVKIDVSVIEIRIYISIFSLTWRRGFSITGLVNLINWFRR